MKAKLSRMGPLFIVIAALIWSFDGILRRSLYALPPAVVVFYEHLLGFMVLIFISYRWIGEIKKLNLKDWLAVGVVSLFSGALGTVLYTAALGKVNYIPFSAVVLLQQLQPIWAIGSASILLKEKISKKFIFLAALGLLAAYLITFKDLRVNFSTGSGTLTAALMALGAGFMWGSSTAVSKVFLKKVSFLGGTAFRFALTPIFALIFVYAGGQAHALGAVSNEQWVALMSIVMSTGLVALTIYYYGLKMVPARVSTICELVWPASAVCIDYFYYHNALSLTQIVGIGLLAVVIYKVSLYQK